MEQFGEASARHSRMLGIRPGDGEKSRRRRASGLAVALREREGKGIGVGMASGCVILERLLLFEEGNVLHSLDSDFAFITMAYMETYEAIIHGEDAMHI
jgi:hypothetical protein